MDGGVRLANCRCTADAAEVDKVTFLGITTATKTLKLDLGRLLGELSPKGELFGAKSSS
jgi:hypothetical protein